MAYFNVMTFDNKFMLSSFNDYWNSDIYNNWPNSGDSSNIGIVSNGTVLPKGKSQTVFSHGKVWCWVGSSGSVEIGIDGTTYSFWGSTTYDTRLFLIMNDTAKGFRVGVYYRDSYYRIRQASKVVNETKYNAILESIPPSYVWQSVPSIMGKGKTIELPQIINPDGNPVTSGSASDFSALPSGAIVRTLANEAISGG